MTWLLNSVRGPDYLGQYFTIACKHVTGRSTQPDRRLKCTEQECRDINHIKIIGCSEEEPCCFLCQLAQLWIINEACTCTCNLETSLLHKNQGATELWCFDPDVLYLSHHLNLGRLKNHCWHMQVTRATIYLASQTSLSRSMFAETTQLGHQTYYLSEQHDLAAAPQMCIIVHSCVRQTNFAHWSDLLMHTMGMVPSWKHNVYACPMHGLVTESAISRSTHLQPAQFS